MTRVLTRPEVAKRLVIRAMHEASPGTAQRDLAAMFHASLRTVNAAVNTPLQALVAALGRAPAGKAPSPASTRPPAPKQHYLTRLAGPAGPSLGPGNRARLIKVRSDDQGGGYDRDLPDGDYHEPSDEGLEAERERQAKAAEQWG